MVNGSNQAIDQLTCGQCGYSLRGLQGVARCPECGLEIDQTLAMYDLSRSDPRWVTRLAVGAMLLLLAAVLGILRDAALEANVFVSRTPRVSLLESFGYYGGILAAWLGWWLVTAPRPGPTRRLEDARGSLRWWARVIIVVDIVARLLGWMHLGDIFPHPVWRIVENMLAAVLVTLINLHLQRLARRIPDVFLIRHLPILLGARLLSLLLLYILPDVGQMAGLSGLTRSWTNRPVWEIMTWGPALYWVYVLFHLWRRLEGAADASVVRSDAGNQQS